MKEELVEKDPLNHVDFGDANFSEVKKEIIYTLYEDEKERKYWKDKSFEADYNIIKKRLPNLEISFASSTADENLWLLSAYSDTDPGAAYLYIPQRDKETSLFRYGNLHGKLFWEHSNNYSII